MGSFCSLLLDLKHKVFAWVCKFLLKQQFVLWTVIQLLFLLESHFALETIMQKNNQ